MARRIQGRHTTRGKTAIGFCVALVGAVLLSDTAFASGGNYLFDGGTTFQQQQVRKALAASSFNWSVIPGMITIHITPTFTSETTPGEIFLDPNLLNSGTYAWGVVQHEYAHLVDFALFDGATHVALTAKLGATAWCTGDAAGLMHSQYGCERFASTLAWSYWPSPENSMKPSEVAGAESAAMAPTAFRALMQNLIGPTAQAETATDAAPSTLGHLTIKHTQLQRR
jgi:hypothetical protein